MFLRAGLLLEEKEKELLDLRKQIKITPTIAVIWIGNDSQTEKFISAKGKMADKLGCQFQLHHLTKISQVELENLIINLNAQKDVHGIIVQLPLPKEINSQKIFSVIEHSKDIDNLQDDPKKCWPTANGIIELLKSNKVDLKNKKTVIIGRGKLVGGPLSKIFQHNNWNYLLIPSRAQEEIDQIHSADILISATGVSNLVTQEMIHKNMIVVDGSGVDADVSKIEPLVKAVTPKTGAIGPLTVRNLFYNLLLSASNI